MSIPKEPRQLMINLMYLVLTAMLALNVSAKIINAFFRINDGIQANNTVTDDTNTFAMEALQANAEQDLSKYQPFVDAAKRVQEISAEFVKYVDSVKDTLVEDTGGYYPEDDPKHHGQPKGYKNKDVTTRILVDQRVGAELKQQILDARSELLSIVRDLGQLEGTSIDDAAIDALAKRISLDISETYKTENQPKNPNKKVRGDTSWEYYTFNQLPLAAIFPMFSQYQNNMKSSEAVILNFLLDNMQKKTFKIDQFIPISSPTKSYVIAGENFQTKISVGATSKSVNENMVVKVNGASIPSEGGVAEWSTRASGLGVKNYTVDITLTNPTTGEQDTYSETFQYEVGLRSATVAADKMNVFYIGVDNPITVSASGVPTADLSVSGSGGGLQLRRTSPGKYIATVTTQGTATVSVSGGGLGRTAFDFRVKRIPDPVAKFAGTTGGTLGNGTFRVQRGVLAELEGFDFDAKCTIAGFNVVYQPPREDIQQVVNVGASFSAQASALIAKAKPGDTYYFQNVRAKCPGDGVTRPINPMVFNIR